MRFSKRKYSVLFHAMTGGDLVIRGIDHKSIVNASVSLSSHFGSLNKAEVVSISSTFENDAVINWKKICTLPINDSFVWLISGDYMHLFKCDYSEEALKINGLSAIFYKNDLVGLLRYENGKTFWAIEPVGEIEGIPKNQHALALATIPVNLLLFKQHATVNPVVLRPKSKINDFHCRYKNDFPFPVTLCDANWYRKSIQGHPFVVRGHWRMQAHGQGMKDRKLKWIDTFWKQGYTKGAYMEK